ncbi:TPA: hypothetical protein NK762_001270 [Enterobacter chengduensis]|nr:hypothetical protein [Enterobacter chengduensis]HCH6697179.1 hypothetical protein [Enterobacter chengduensis]
MKNSVTNVNPCSDTQEIESLPAYRQALADEAVSNSVPAVERIRARLALLESYISDSPVPQGGVAAFRARIAGLLGELEGDGKRGTVLMHVHRRLRDLEDRIYIPVRRMAAAQFEQLRRDEPDMAGDVLLKTLVGAEIGEYQARNPEASKIATLAAIMRSSPRADILINMIRQRNDENPVTIFSWQPLALPLLDI